MSLYPSQARNEHAHMDIPLSRSCFPPLSECAIQEEQSGKDPEMAGPAEHGQPHWW